jgi:hypothetical protein
VRQPVELELEPNVNSLSSVELRQQGGQWEAWLKATRKRFMDYFARTEVAFQLGPPGSVASERPLKL